MGIQHWFSKRAITEKQTLGLILPGGGARNAYQVGVLKAVEELLPTGTQSPFPVVTGTSAGSLNAGMIASRSSDFSDGMRRLLGMWENLHMDMVVKTDAKTAAKTGARWVWSFASGGMRHSQPDSLLDNTPLRHLIENHVNLARMRQCIQAGQLRALGITASSYARGASITYFEGDESIPEWERTRRFGNPARLRIDHFMASIAIPVVFPAVKLNNEYHGDGSMRESAPLSPALHLGANKLLIISVRNPTDDASKMAEPVYPNLGQIAGYMFDTLFIDRLDSDIERLDRINFALSKTRQSSFRHNDALLRPIEFLVISPSVDIRDIVAKHTRSFPRSMRVLLSGLGAMTKEGRPLTSYLLFDSAFARDLIELGYKDGYAQREKLQELLEL
jgi:NTE family protein